MNMDSNHDIVPTLRMFDGLMMNQAADEIERLRARETVLAEMLRSAHAVAERRGQGTAWDRLAASIQALGVGSITARTYRVLPSDEEAAPLPAQAEPVATTPSSHWRSSGEADPHAGHYDGERAALTLGKLTDDELANGAFMNYDQKLTFADLVSRDSGKYPPIVWMTAVKDRIRWLSRALETALATPPAAQAGAPELSSVDPSSALRQEGAVDVAEAHRLATGALLFRIGLARNAPDRDTVLHQLDVIENIAKTIGECTAPAMKAQEGGA